MPSKMREDPLLLARVATFRFDGIVMKPRVAALNATGQKEVKVPELDELYRRSCLLDIQGSIDTST